MKVILILIFTFGAMSACVQGRVQPVAKNGVMDLRGWSLEQDGSVLLTGEWEFYWKRLLKQDVESLPVKTGLFRMPGNWNGYELADGRELSGEGYATYRLRLNLEPGELALNIPDINTAYRLYVNGRLLSSSGRVAKEKSKGVPQEIPRTVNFQNPGDALEILLEISNYHFKGGGPWLPIELGTKVQMSQARDLRMMFLLFVVGALVIMGFYHFGVFFIRREEPTPLYFGLFCLLIAIYNLVSGEKFLVNVMPNVPWEVYVKLEFVTVYLGFPALASFLNGVFPRILYKWVLPVIWGVSLLFVLPVLIFSAGTYSFTMPWYQGIMLLEIAYGIYALLVAVARRMEGAATFLLGFLILGIAASNDILFHNQIIESSDLLPYGLFAFIFTQVYVLSTRSTAAFAAVEDLTNEMEAKVWERTQEAEAGRRQLEKLTGLSRRISEAGGLPSVLTAVHQALVEQLGPLSVWLLLVDGRREEIYLDSYRPRPNFRYTDEQHKFIKNFRVPLKPESGTLYRTYIKRRSCLVDRITNDWRKLSPADLSISENIGITSFAQMPLMVQNEVIGILVVRGGGVIRRKYLPWLKLFADQVGGAVHSANLLDRAEQARLEIHELNEFSKKLNATTVLKETLDYICTYVQKNYNVEGVFILRTNLESGKLVHQYDSLPAPLEEFARTLEVPLDERGGIIYWVYRRRKAFYVSPEMFDRDKFRKTYSGMEFSRSQIDILGRGLSSFLLVPLIVQEEVIGMAIFTGHIAGAGLGAQDIRAIERFCQQIAGGLRVSLLLNRALDKQQTADQTRAEVEQLNQLSRHINETTDIEAVLDDVFAYFNNVFGIDGAALYLHDPDENELYILKYSKALQDLVANENLRQVLRFPLEDSSGTMYATFRRRKTLYLKNVQRQLRRNRLSAGDRLILETWGINDLLEIPLVIQKKTIGILCLSRLKKPMDLTKAELVSIEQTCEQIAGAVHGSSLFKQVEERTGELALANQKLQQAYRAKNRFFANISHEFRTPLTLILAPMEALLKGDYGNFSRANKVFKSVIQNGQRLLRLINNLLDFTKIEEGRMSVRKQKTDMVELLEYYKNSVQAAVESEGLEIVFENNTRGLIEYVDRDLIEKAIMNLLSNAIKFTPAGGVITLQLDKNQDSLAISVKDTGFGVPEEQQEMIFKRFIQVDGTTFRKYEGTGIGLSLVKEIVELHGGEISVLNRHKQGAAFTITIPLGIASDETADIAKIQPLKNYLMADLPGKEQEAKGPPDEGEVSHEHSILLVEDNSDMRDFLETVLEGEYAIHTAEDGKEGLARAIEFRPDLILSDVMMPEMDGYEMTQELKRQLLTKDIPIILLSAKADVDNRIEGLEFGADDYLSKPFNSDELLVRIRNQIEGKNLERKLKREMRERDKEFEQAALVQENILTPRSYLNKIDELEIDFVYLPMNGRVSGDYYNISRMDKGIVSVFIADATGHGTQAALSTMQIDMLYRESRREKYPNERFEQINSKFVSEVHSKSYFTGVSVDIHEDRIRYSSAGHPEQILIKGKDKELQKFRTGGAMIGIMETQDYDMSELKFESGDILLLFTDGIYEVFSEDREEFGEKRFIELVRAGIRDGFCTMPIHRVIKSILGSLDEYRGAAPFEDDITLIGIRLK